MSLVGIEYVWHRQITDGDFFNIERAPTTTGTGSGGGQRFIDIPITVREGLFTMLGIEIPADPTNEDTEWPEGIVNARVLGNPTISGTLHFALQPNRR